MDVVHMLAIARMHGPGHHNRMFPYHAVRADVVPLCVRIASTWAVKDLPGHATSSPRSACKQTLGSPGDLSAEGTQT